MFETHVAREMDIPVGEVWKAVEDFGGVYRYHPLVESSPLSAQLTSGEGAERVCHFHGGGSIQEKVCDFEPGKGYTIEITDPGSFPLKEARGRIEVEALSDDRTRVTFSMHFLPKFGLLGAIMARVMMKAQFRKLLSRVLEGLEVHLKTGAIVGPKGRLSAA